MPDIEITCPKCANVVTISEFADTDGLACQACGEPLTRPQMMSLEPRPVTRRLRVKEVVELEEAATVAPDQPVAAEADEELEDEGPPKMKKTLNAASWIVFILLAAAMATWRYAIGVTPEQSDLIREYGPYVVLGFHIVITLRAFADSVFQGILCLLVPLYSVYYLFVFCDGYMLRAVFAGLMVGIGQESFETILRIIGETYQDVSGWIRSGGEADYEKVLK